MILDTGVFVLAERMPRRAQVMLRRFRDEPLLTNEAVMAQVWRNPPRQVQLHRFLSLFDVQIEPLTNGKEIGVLLAKAGKSDVVDASVAHMAITRNDIVLTADPVDIRAMGAAALTLGP